MNPFLSRLITMSNALKSGSKSYRKKKLNAARNFIHGPPVRLFFSFHPLIQLSWKIEKKERRERRNFIIKYLNLTLLCFVLRDDEQEKNERNLNFISDKKVFGVSFSSITENKPKRKKLIGFWLENVHRLPLRGIDKDT